MRSLEKPLSAPIAARVLAALFACLCAALLCASPVVALAATPITEADYDDDGANFGNVVLLIRFAGDTVGDNADGYNTIKNEAYSNRGVFTEWGYLGYCLNASEYNSYFNVNSMRQYFTYASGGKTSLYNYLP